MDIFHEDVVPKKFSESIFLKHLERLLAPGGILTFNRMITREPLEEQADEFYFQAFQPVFRDCEIFRMIGNLVYVYRKPGISK